MSDERIQHLTELAQRLWPDSGAEVTGANPDHASVDTDYWGEIEIRDHEGRALEMLEAALLVGVHGRQTVIGALARLSSTPSRSPDDCELSELRSRLSIIRDAHQRYQRGDIDREEYEGTIAAVAEEP